MKALCTLVGCVHWVMYFVRDLITFTLNNRGTVTQPIVFHKPKRHINRVFLHCSASDNPRHDNVASIRKWHLQNGWSDIGYHYLISKDGKIHAGRNIEITPASQKGHNTGTIAICLSGLAKDQFTQAQFNSLRAFCHEINKAYPQITFHGHCEVSSKTCPVFDYKSVLCLDTSGKLIG